MRTGFSCAAALLVAQAVGAGTTPAYISTAVADPGRPDTDRERDVGRKPAEVVAFAGIKPGDKVADFMPGNGYFTRIFCKIVGDSGHVYAITVPRNAPAGSPPAAEPPAQACANVTATTLQVEKRSAPELWSSNDDPGVVYEYSSLIPAAENFAAPEPLDLIWTSENYHDLHNERFGAPNMRVVNKALLKALKPGGILMIEDHGAAPGSGARDTNTLHRIEAQQVKKEVIAAGFVFVGESKVLRNAHDPHTAKAHELHDKTDRFLLKFRKPGGHP
jgi:predicted methyltransferase